MNGITFDAGGLIAVDRDNRRIVSLLAKARQLGLRIAIPTTALAQVMRYPARQAHLSRLVHHVDTDLIPLDGPDATAVGRLLARTRTADIVDAHVVVCAERAGHVVATSDPRDIRRLSDSLDLFVV